MRIVRKQTELPPLIRQARREGKRIGLVPTMGALHKGHLSLIQRARSDNDLVVVSLFVNPIQFDRSSDLRHYPRSLQHDVRLCAEAGTDLLFIPSARRMYPPSFQTTVEVRELSRLWEGRFRPGHLQGVATVVAKLFHLVQPDVAYFGQKDAQQARIVRQMIRDLDFPIHLQVMPTLREPDGLAMSSRNRRLSSDERRHAALLFHALQEARRLIKWGHRRKTAILRRMRAVLRHPKIRVEYIALVDPKTFRQVSSIQGDLLILLAVWIGKVRLIDCCLIRPGTGKERL